MTTSTDKDVIELLVEQHDQIRQLFARLQTAQGSRKQELFADFVRLLTVHETAEEEIVHPRARTEISFGRQVVADRREEEHEARRALADLYDLGVAHPEFDAKLAALADAVVAHATHEEADEFLALRESLPAEELIDMAGALRIAESTAPTRPHALRGEPAPTTMLVYPPVAISDRLRNALRSWRR